MLDDEEFVRVTSLRGSGTEGDLRERQFAPVLKEYERITGFRETNTNSRYTDRPISIEGNRYERPRAKLCGFCMQRIG
jgi:hypothetical protein